MRKSQAGELDKASIFRKASREWRSGHLKSAFQLMLEAALLGDSGAQHNVGYFYEEGIGTVKNREQALKWYRRAAAKGESSSAINVGILYKNEENYSRAKVWLERALRMGDVDAHLELAKLYIARKRMHAVAEQHVRTILRAKDCTPSCKEEARLMLKGR